MSVAQTLPLRGQARTPCCSPDTAGINGEEVGFTVTTSLECLQTVWRFCTGYGKPGSIVTSRAILTWYIRLGFCEGAWKLVWTKS